MALRKQISPPVLIVGAQLETLDGLQQYLGDVGIQSRCSRELAEIDAAQSIVLFPDDFADAEVSRCVVSLVSAKRSLCIVIVTSNAPRFALMLSKYSNSVSKMSVLPRPAFGWAIADALKAMEQTPVAVRGSRL